MPSFTVYKGAADGTPVKSTTSKPDDLVGDQVLLKVLASGVCGTGTFSLSFRGQCSKLHSLTFFVPLDLHYVRFESCRDLIDGDFIF